MKKQKKTTTISLEYFIEILFMKSDFGDYFDTHP